MHKTSNSEAVILDFDEKISLLNFFCCLSLVIDFKDRRNVHARCIYLKSAARGVGVPVP
jgi:hypothetical protein